MQSSVQFIGCDFIWFWKKIHWKFFCAKTFALVEKFSDRNMKKCWTKIFCDFFIIKWKTLSKILRQKNWLSLPHNSIFTVILQRGERKIYTLKISYFTHYDLWFLMFHFYASSCSAIALSLFFIHQIYMDALCVCHRKKKWKSLQFILFSFVPFDIIPRWDDIGLL